MTFFLISVLGVCVLAAYYHGKEVSRRSEAEKTNPPRR